MKKLLFALFFIVLFATPGLTVELNPDASVIKKLAPQGYNSIKEQAVVEYGTNHFMVLSTINLQAKSAREVLQLISSEGVEGWKAFMVAVNDYSHDGEAAKNLDKIMEMVQDTNKLTVENFFSLKVNWFMVLSTVRLQLESMESY